MICGLCLRGKDQTGGSILAAYCVCLGGRDGGSKHVAAALYSLDNLLNTEGNKSVNKWALSMGAQTKARYNPYVRGGCIKFQRKFKL
jgi:hypothetical protein